MPKAPACKSCNSEKSGLEHYLMAVLPFGASHPHAFENLTDQVAGRLAKNLKLQRDLEASLQPTWVRDRFGAPKKTFTLSIDRGKLDALLGLIARGLAWHEFKLYLSGGNGMSILWLTNPASYAFRCRLNGWRTDRLNRSLGDGTFEYTGLRVKGQADVTVWGISIYGGLRFTSTFGFDPEPEAAMTRIAWIVTGTDEARAQITSSGDCESTAVVEQGEERKLYPL